MTAFALKIIALTAMLIDHAGIMLAAALPEYSHIFIWFRIIGRLAWPIFAFLLAEGFRHTKSQHRFLMRLLAFAIISEIPYDLAMGNSISFVSNTNIFYTLFLGGMAICLYERLREKHWRRGARETMAFLGAIFPTAVLAGILTADFGGMGVLFIFTMYIINTKPKWLPLAAMGGFILSQFNPLVMAHSMGIEIKSVYLLMIPFALATVPLAALYNGQHGLSDGHVTIVNWLIKWLFYVAYPAHLAVLAIIAMMI